jgi:hypothetical protein
MKGTIKIEFEVSKDFVSSFAKVMCSQLPDMAKFEDWLSRTGVIYAEEHDEFIEMDSGSTKMMLSSVIIAAYCEMNEREGGERND